ncbi:MAG: VWA domain-containing protein [Myxococcales bacterium]
MSKRLLALSVLLLFAACGEARTRALDRHGGTRGDAGEGDGDDSSDDDGHSRDTDPSGADDDSDDPGQGADPGTCARADVTLKRVIPTVWLLVDGSGSMATSLTGGLNDPSRFRVLRSALMADQTGLVAKLQGVVSFGLFVYDGGMSPPGVHIDGVCPRVVDVAPRLDNYAPINTAYPADPTGASTPTHYALLSLQQQIKQAGPSAHGPTFVVLATDGKPNLCDFHDGVPASEATEQEAVRTVRELAAAGTKTFAISLAGGDRELEAHLDALAEAGGTGESAFTPTSSDALVAVLTKIIGGAVSCDVRLEGTLTEGHQCDGDVLLNGKALACDGQDGFHVKDDLRTLELRGAACKTLQQDPKATLEASFACDAIVLL